MNTEQRKFFFGWHSIAIVGRLNVFPVSIPVAFLVLILARISQCSITTLPELFQFLTVVLDAPVFDIPINMQRIFWLSLLVSVVKLFYNFFCPEIIKGYRDFDDWKEHSKESADFQNQFEHEYGEENKDKLPDSLQKDYITSISKAGNEIWWARSFITFILAVSAYLTIRVMWDQLLIAAKATDWLDIFL